MQLGKKAHSRLLKRPERGLTRVLTNVKRVTNAPWSGGRLARTLSRRSASASASASATGTQIPNARADVVIAVALPLVARSPSSCVDAYGQTTPFEGLHFKAMARTDIFKSPFGFTQLMIAKERSFHHVQATGFGFCCSLHSSMLRFIYHVDTRKKWDVFMRYEKKLVHAHSMVFSF